MYLERVTSQTHDTLNRVLVVDDDPDMLAIVQFGLNQQGFDVICAASGYDALNAIDDFEPTIVVSDVHMPGLTGFELVSRLRSQPETAHIPVLLMSGEATLPEDSIYGLELGADDYVHKPLSLSELGARITRRLNQGQTGGAPTHRARNTIHSYEAFLASANYEINRSVESGHQGVIGIIGIAEVRVLLDRIGNKGVDQLLEELARTIPNSLGKLASIGRDNSGRLLIAVPEKNLYFVERRLNAFAKKIAGKTFYVDGERIHLTLASGITSFENEIESAPDLLNQALLALDISRDSLDLCTAVWDPEMQQAPKIRRKILPKKIQPYLYALSTLIIGMGVPFLAYTLAAAHGFDLVHVAYIVVVVALVLTGTMIWVEGFCALRATKMPEKTSRPYGSASAIIAAYMPNEAATILDTLEAFLRLDYDADLQVILAYNTPHPLPIEKTLQELAEREPRLEILRVPDSTSKAQNVNYALSYVRGEIVGIFDADHQPDRNSFQRAWNWLCDDYDVVQGHCVVRNGNASWVARTIAVEFEAIYAVSHPGRAKFHAFGIFGGSNGYWRTDLLRSIRMRGSMLTEDIDSSIRLLEQGGRIASDPHLYSRELAPTNLSALWNQRMRWAQGWFQVSMRHVLEGMFSSTLSARQKAGIFMLLGWREMYPWISIQMIPIVAFLALQAGGVNKLSWFVPLLVMTTLFTFSVGPGQVIFAWKLATPEVKKNKSWFVTYFLVSGFFYTEMKNMINRISQIQEIARNREWKVTPRSVELSTDASPQPVLETVGN